MEEEIYKNLKYIKKTYEEYDKIKSNIFLDKDGNIVLKGVLQKFDTINRNPPYYRIDEFFENAERKIKRSLRQKKLERILNQ